MLSATRTGAVLAAALLAGAAAAPALADSASPDASGSPVAVPAGLYGKDDPTYDGVWRQSLSLIALHSVKVTPAKEAVRWLAGQQCANGGWPSYRADTADDCTSATEDSNATAAAVQALVTLGGYGRAVDRAVSWLKDNQNDDAGWSYNPGGASDANSTSLAISALVAAGTDPAGVMKRGRSAYGGLAAFQLGCDSGADRRGAFAYQPDKSGGLIANDLASAQAALAAAGGSLPVENGTRRAAPTAAPKCPAGAERSSSAGGGVSKAAAMRPPQSAEAVSHYLVRRLASGKQRLMQTLPGASPTADFAATSWAVLGLVAAGHPDQVTDAADWLAGNGYGWMRGDQESPDIDPTAAATLLLVARATGLDPYNFGGSNVVQLLVDSGPAPVSLPSAAASAASAQPDGTLPPGSSVTGVDEDENGGFSPLWLLGMGLVAGIGGGLFISFTNRRADRLGSGPGGRRTGSAGRRAVDGGGQDRDGG
jgi:hypothetical protein